MNMISDLRNSLQALTLELFVPSSSLTDEQLAAIIHYRGNLFNPNARAEFCAQMPAVVANLRENNQHSERIDHLASQDWALPKNFISAKHPDGRMSRYRPDQGDLDFLELVRFEVEQIYKTLMGDDVFINAKQIDTGVASIGRSGLIHSDSENPPTNLNFTIRFCNSPCWTIDGKQFLSLSAEDGYSVEEASNENNANPDLILLNLFNRKILKEVPVGSLIMMATGADGTRHCSKPEDLRNPTKETIFMRFGQHPQPL